MSKYLEKIQSGIQAAGTNDEGVKNVHLLAGTLLVEVVERERKTSSGIILSARPEGKELTECVVLATGQGYFDDETGEDVPLDTRVGDIIYAEPMNVRLLYAFPVAGYSAHTIGLIDQGQVLMRFRGEAAVSAFRKGAGLSE
jgi:co-chaperonin GroES (HSP10)